MRHEQKIKDKPNWNKWKANHPSTRPDRRFRGAERHYRARPAHCRIAGMSNTLYGGVVRVAEETRRAALEWYAADDARLFEQGLVERVTDRPATEALK